MRNLTSVAPKTDGAGATQRTKRRGFTLIEVMCAVVITVVGLVSTFYLVGLSSSVNTDARNVTQAQQICQQEIELLRNMPYATLKPIVRASSGGGIPDPRFLKADGSADSSRPGDPGYPGQIPSLSTLRGGTGSLIVTNDPVVLDQAKHVTVVVRWTDPGNRQRSTVMGTIIAQGGMGVR